MQKSWTVEQQLRHWWVDAQKAEGCVERCATALIVRETSPEPHRMPLHAVQMLSAPPHPFKVTLARMWSNWTSWALLVGHYDTTILENSLAASIKLSTHFPDDAAKSGRGMRTWSGVFRACACTKLFGHSASQTMNPNKSLLYTVACLWHFIIVTES